MHPVLLALGPLRIYSYGALIALGGVLSAMIWKAKRERMGLRSDDEFWLLLNVILFGGFIGGRVLFILEYVPFRAETLWSAIFSFSKGFSVLGAFVGVGGGVWLFCRRRRLEFLRLIDYVCLIAPFWHVFGRLGCLAAGCCYGRPTRLPWGLRFADPAAMVPGSWRGLPLHPTQLYEAAGDAAIFLALYFAVLPRAERGRLPRGFLAGAYFAAYGVLRFFVEFCRGDTVSGFMGMSAGQGLSLALAAAGAAFMAATRLRSPKCIPS
ncbi:MAG: prolipoprotein diacylglyceryl transferase [Elusimicrobia bacterium]|nr:prolipoprotein diacylglyceryl transferase [Elusimicrobiota bacterium]